jgi:hypothetical protein
MLILKIKKNTKMRTKFILLFTFITTISTLAQKNESLCKVNVEDISKITSFGYLIGYSVQFKNYSSKSVDGIYWTAYYYNNDNTLIKSEETAFNSTNLIDPIVSGTTKTIARSPRVKGASKVIIRINKLHFVDNSTCSK